jgi:fructose transport system substrate-binding protein
MHRGKVFRWQRSGVLALLASASLLLSACGGDSGGGASSGGEPIVTDASKKLGIEVPGGDTVGVSLILKNANNPFFIALTDAAEAEAKEVGVDLQVTAGKADGDEDTQIQAVEAAVARGDDGILITTNGPGVNPALQKAKDAGLTLIALDTPLDPADLADFTFASNNYTAGELDGKWAAAQLNGEKAIIAMLDLFNDKVVSVDYARENGFLMGMGIDPGDEAKNGDEPSTGEYQGFKGGKGGEYEIVCHEPTTGSNDGGKTGMERCISKDPDINVIYSINEPAGQGGSEALTATGGKAIVVSIDGGCGGVDLVSQGVLNATALQYPSRMAAFGVDTIASLARGGEAPENSPGLDYYNTGLTLVTDEPVDGLESVTSEEAKDLCWG